MCMIVDTNQLGKLLVQPEDEDTAPVHKWLRKGRGRIVYSTGGKFEQEIVRTMRDRLREYSRNGRARLVPAEDVARMEQSLRDDPRRRSDDPHIIALARVSRARLLYSGDKDLIKDFTSRDIIKGPRGKVYSGSRNAGLLTRDACPAD